MKVDELETEWTEKAKKWLVGCKVVDVRYMSKKEARNHGWSHRPVVLVLDNGTMIYPSKDDEGNDAGTMFGSSATGEDRTLPVLW